MKEDMIPQQVMTVRNIPVGTIITILDKFDLKGRLTLRGSNTVRTIRYLIHNDQLVRHVVTTDYRRDDYYTIRCKSPTIHGEVGIRTGRIMVIPCDPDASDCCPVKLWQTVQSLDVVGYMTTEEMLTHANKYIRRSGERRRRKEMK